MENIGELSGSLTQEEIESIKKKIEELNGIIEKATRRKVLTDYSNLRPLGYINVEEKTLTFSFSKRYDTETWNCFRQLAKLLHTKTGGFYNYRSVYGRKQISKNCDKKIKYLEELTPEQLEISAEMIDRMVKIYNEYYYMLHSSVFYRNENGEIETHEVEHPQQEIYGI